MDDRFSDTTQAALIEVAAERYTHGELTVLFRRFGVSEDLAGSASRLTRVIRLVDNLSTRTSQHGNDLLELMRDLLEERIGYGPFKGLVQRWPAFRRLVNSLKADGYEVLDGELVRTNPEAMPIAEEMSRLAAELAGHGWTVALNHYRQALDNFTDGEFESSNGQLRSFLEDVLARLAEQRTSKRSSDPRGNVEHLRNAGLLNGDETQLLKGLVGISNTKGAHPGLSNVDEALFRLHMATITVRWLLSLP